MKRALGRAALVLALALVPATAFAYDEAVSPDLSSNPAAPTPLTLVVGNNQIKGTVRNTSPADLRDYVTFTVAPGQQLTAIRMLSYTNVVGGTPGNTGFHAINLGATSQLPDPAGNNADFYLGGDHLFPVAPTDNVLLDLADGEPAGTGFTAPLGPGTYTYLIQQVSGAVAYDVQLVIAAPIVTAAPATTPWLLALLTGTLALAGLLAMRRLRRVSTQPSA